MWKLSLSLHTFTLVSCPVQPQSDLLSTEELHKSSWGYGPSSRPCCILNELGAGRKPQPLFRFLYSKTFIDGLFYPYFIFCITRRQHVYSPTAMMRRILHMTEDSGGLLGGINKSNSKEVTSHFQVT